MSDSLFGLQQHRFEQGSGDNCVACGLDRGEHETELTFRDGVTMERERLASEILKLAARAWGDLR